MPTINGTSGNDAIAGTIGADDINGLEGSDTIDGGAGDDTIDGGQGPDMLTGGAGNDTLIGRGGFNVADIAVYAGNRADYEIVTGGTTTITGLGAFAGEGTDTLLGIEQLQFADMTISLGINPNNPPQMGQPGLSDQAAEDGSDFTYTIPATAFFDFDSPLVFTARLADGSPLPGWLTFDESTRTFAGIPPLSAIGVTYDILVTARDQLSDPAEDFDDYQVSDNFTLTISQASGPDIVGTDASDSLHGTFREETLIGLGGDDAFYGSPDADRMNGGADWDTVDYSSSPQAVTINLATGSASGGDAEGDVLLSIENAIGSAFNDNITGTLGMDTISGTDGDDILNGSGGDDTINGGNGNDILDGGAGHDTLNGDAGNDRLIGASGNDVIDGGTGIDRVDCSAAAASVTVNLMTGAGTSTVGDLAGIGIDTLIAIESATGSNFSDTITGTDTFNALNGGGGDDWLSGAGGSDALIGGDGNDQVFGGLDDDILDGEAGSDLLDAGSGNDEIYGGSGDDVLIGGAGMDFLFSDTGDDTFRGTAAELGGDWILDFSIDDRIVISDANIANFTFSLSGGTLTYTGGALTLSVLGSNHNIVASAAAGGGVQLTIQQTVNEVRNDFNGDGRSDILWRDNTGAITNSLGQANGGFASNAANFWTTIPTSWSVIGTGDFNGDARADIQWRNPSTGEITNWLGQANGSFVGNDTNFYTTIPTSWQVVGTGDFNGDGRDDLLWRNGSTGQTTNWLAQANGSFVGNDANALGTIGTSWFVAGTGDFNGDGRSDILWRDNTGAITNSLGQANGGFASNAANFWTTIPTSWQIAGTGDFNGDGLVDLLWRNPTTGEITNWLGQANGSFIGNDTNFYTTIPTSWQVEGIGDFNGDGRDDLLWRNGSTGQTTDWLAQPNGSFVGNDANALSTIATNWQVQPDNFI